MNSGAKKTLQIQNDLAELARVRDEIAAFIGDLLSPVELNRVLLAVDEALTNALKYGQLGDARPALTLYARRESARLVFVLEDQGVPFDPASQAPPDLEHYSMKGESAGLGVHLYRTLMETHHEEREGGGNRLTLIRPLKGADDSP